MIGYAFLLMVQCWTHTAGADIHCKLFNFYLPTKLCTTFDGEIEIIVVAVQKLWIHSHLFEKVAILSDSKSSL